MREENPLPLQLGGHTNGGRTTNRTLGPKEMAIASP